MSDKVMTLEKTVSRQRLWQIKKQKAGSCIICGKKRDGDNRQKCLNCHRKEVETRRNAKLAIARQARDTCARVMCGMCEKFGPPDFSSNGYCHEGDAMMKCQASAIHALSDEKLMGEK